MKRTLTGLALVVLCTTGCMIGPSYKQKELAMNSHWTTGESPAVIAGDPEITIDWWNQFQDPVLTELINQALAENLDIEAAGLRVLQARSSKVRAKDLLFPVVLPEAGYGRQYFSKNVRPEVEVSGGKVNIQKGSFGIQNRPDLGIITPPSISFEKPSVSLADHLDVYNVGASAIWEPDFWGQTRRRMKSAAAAYEASIAEYDTIVVLVAAEVATTYIQLRTVDARIEQLSENANYLERLAGTSDESEVGQGNHSMANSLLSDTKAKLVDLRAARTEYENAICYLLGKLPGSLTEQLAPNGMIPSPPLEIAIGMPADLLRRRPDVREAERMAAAQSEKVGITKAGLYPSFSLLGTIGYAASESGDLFDSDSVTKGYGAKVSWNILLYPFIQEKARMQEARYQEAIVNLEQTVIRAAMEAENALNAYLRSYEKNQFLKESADEANAASEGRLETAESESAAFDSAFTALEYRLAQNDKYIDARGAQAMHMVQLYAALGGGWEVQAGVPFVKEATRDEMRDRTDWWSFGGKKRLDSTR